MAVGKGQWDVETIIKCSQKFLISETQKLEEKSDQKNAFKFKRVLFQQK